MAYPFVTSTHATEEDLLVRARMDLHQLCPRGQSLAAGDDGVLDPADPWQLASWTVNWAAQGVGAGRLVKVGSVPAGMGGPPQHNPTLGPRGMFYVVDGVPTPVGAPFAVVLRGAGSPSGAGQGPGSFGAASGVQFEVPYLDPELAAADREVQVDLDLSPIGDALDPEQRRELVIDLCLSRLYEAAARMMGQPQGDSFAAKATYLRRDYDRRLERALARRGHGPVGGTLRTPRAALPRRVPPAPRAAPGYFDAPDPVSNPAGAAACGAPTADAAPAAGVMESVGAGGSPNAPIAGASPAIALPPGLLMWTGTSFATATPGVDVLVPGGPLDAAKLHGLVPAGALPATGVVAGAYPNATVTVDATGRVTAIAPGSGAGVAAVGLLKGTGTAVVPAVAGQDFQPPLPSPAGSAGLFYGSDGTNIVLAAPGGAATAPRGTATADVRLTPYGAQANTPTFDCAPAINAAIRAVANLGGGVVFLPSGTWYCQTPVILRAANVALQGEGRGATVLQMAPTASRAPGVLVALAPDPESWQASRRDTRTIAGCGWATGSAAVTTAAWPIFLCPGSRVRLGSDPATYTVAAVGMTGFTLTAAYQGASGSGAVTRDMAYLAAMPTAFAADHKLDAFGKLDATVAPTTGRAWGFATRSPSSGSPYADHMLAFVGGGPHVGKGDGWGDTATLTIDLALEFAGSGRPTGMAVCGMGRFGSADPWFLAFDNSANTKLPLNFSFLTSDGVQRQVEFGDFQAAAGVQRVTLQVDMTTASAGGTYDPSGAGSCSVRAWVGGHEQAINRRTNAGSTFLPAANLTFARNRTFPFSVGSQGGIGTWTDAFGAAADVADRGNFTVWGLCFSPRGDYTSDPSGTQVLSGANGGTAGAAPSDKYRYLATGGRAAWICDYKSDDAPAAAGAASMVAARFRSYWSWNVYSCGLWTPNTSMEASAPPPRGVALRDLSVRGFPAGAVVGNLYDPTFERCEFSGGWYGIASANGCANVYDVRVADCLLSGAECGYYGWGQIVYVTDPIRADVPGGCLLRFDGCSFVATGIVAGQMAPGTSLGVVDVVGSPMGHDYASSGRIVGISSDDEVSPTQVPLVYAEKLSSGSTLSISGVVARNGTAPALVQLVDSSGSGRPGRFRLAGDGLPLGTAAVSVQGTAWQGTVEGFDDAIAATTQPVALAAGTAATKVRTIHYLDDVPNNLPGAAGSRWVAGAHEIRRRNPPGGGWTVAFCSGSGIVGGNPAPAWATFDPMP